ncbi:MAG: hypothetical protein C0392_03370 [Syntrophus sp. (in: bacteria)]|nr:hypothetical protein [Syntrophus sp. (in: bacteria)]
MQRLTKRIRSNLPCYATVLPLYSVLRSPGLTIASVFCLHLQLGITSVFIEAPPIFTDSAKLAA